MGMRGLSRTRSQKIRFFFSGAYESTKDFMTVINCERDAEKAGLKAHSELEVSCEI